MTRDFSNLSIDQRLQGLDRSQLLTLRDRCDNAIAEIESGGKIDMWVVSDDAVNLYWDTSYIRACHYLEKELRDAKSAVYQSVYELRKQRIFANELKSYEADYGPDWKKVQAEIDAANTKEAA